MDRFLVFSIWIFALGIIISNIYSVNNTSPEYYLCIYWTTCRAVRFLYLLRRSVTCYMSFVGRRSCLYRSWRLPWHAWWWQWQELIYLLLRKLIIFTKVGTSSKIIKSYTHISSISPKLNSLCFNINSTSNNISISPVFTIWRVCTVLELLLTTSIVCPNITSGVSFLKYVR